MSALRLMLLSLLLAGLSGCGGSMIYKSLQAKDVALLMVDQVQQQPKRYLGVRLRWGGEVISVENHNDHSRITLLSRPLDSEGRPLSDQSSPGRFIVEVPGFVDPAEYAEGRLLTVVGRLSGIDQGAVGDYPYTYPLVHAEQRHLWPPRLQREVIYYEPLFDPWFYPGYPYRPIYPYGW